MNERRNDLKRELELLETMTEKAARLERGHIQAVREAGTKKEKLNAETGLRIFRKRFREYLQGCPQELENKKCRLEYDGGSGGGCDDCCRYCENPCETVCCELFQ